MFNLIRGMAAQLVLIGHLINPPLYDLPVLIQNLGVMCFFWISGFLITLSAMRKESFQEFFIDRAARMFTPYIPCLILIVVLGVAFNLKGPLDARTFAGNVLMLQDFPVLRVDRLGTGRMLWSVAMEWWIYMGFGALFFFRGLPWWGFPLGVAGLFIIAYNATNGMLTYTWFAGSLAAWMWTRPVRAPWKFLFGLGCLPLLHLTRQVL
jgi:peptidoglycan/LPS O-acetylase OafA/YrhL